MPAILKTVDLAHGAAAECVAKGSVTYRVECTAFRRFSSALSSFTVQLNEADTLENWAHQVGYWKIFRLRYATSIVSAEGLMRTWRMRSSAPPISSLLGSADARTAASFASVNEAFRALQSVDQNPLWRAFLDWLSDMASDSLAQESDAQESLLCSRPTIGILCQSNDLFGEMCEMARNAENATGYRISVVKATQLKDLVVFDRLVVFGSWLWLERKGLSFVFRAPRCRQLISFCFSAIPDYRPQFYQLAGSPHEYPRASDLPPTRSHRGFFTKLLATNFAAAPENDPVEASKLLDDMIPRIDLDKISSRMRGSASDEITESIEARLAELSGGRGVWLSQDGMAYKMEVDDSSGAATCKRIKHVQCSELDPGDVLIFSTAGGGDMISEEANLLMGKHADAMRASQSLWKEALRSMAKTFGASQLCDVLRASGVGSASLANLRNWINPANIAPANREHFIAMLKKCGLESDVDAITEATDRIRRAHLAAGFWLSKKLHRMIQGKPLTDLTSAGYQVFGGNEAITSEKTAFILEAISTISKAVDSSEINKPFALEASLWH